MFIRALSCNFLIKGLSARETTETVNRHLPNECALTQASINKYIEQIKAESKNWLNQMAFDVHEFMYEVKERWDSLLVKALSKTLSKILDYQSLQISIVE